MFIVKCQRRALALFIRNGFMYSKKQKAKSHYNFYLITPENKYFKIRKEYAEMLMYI